jgi:crossover junction endodeoxyribonuclease RusA
VIKLTLPYGPSANHYLGRFGSRSYLKPAAKEYHKKVAFIIAKERLGRAIEPGPISVVYRIWHPDARRRDLFNVEKVMSDSLTRCGFWRDDVDIVDGRVIRMGIDRENPRVEVEVEYAR